MGITDVLKRMRQSKIERKSEFKAAARQMDIMDALEERRKSANLRELERLQKEEDEAAITHELKVMRKRREYDINFAHNPLNIRNVTVGDQWEVLRNQNIFDHRTNLMGRNLFFRY